MDVGHTRGMGQSGHAPGGGILGPYWGRLQGPTKAHVPPPEPHPVISAVAQRLDCNKGWD